MGKPVRSVLWVVVMVLLLPLQATAGRADSAKGPIKVFILAGQSNMEGQGMVEAKDAAGNEKPGTLTAMLADPAKAPLLKHLRTPDGKWAERDDVWVYDINESGTTRGPLGLGYGWNPGSKDWFGPELQFGYAIKNHIKNPVLIIKTAWGGKSLYADFRPPSSGGTAGPYYTQMLATVQHVLSNLKQEFPAYDGRGYELAGFVWWHGWNDFCDPKHAVPEYEQNLANLIRDLRRDLKAPNLPVVIGEFTGPWGADCKEPVAQAVRNAQSAVAAMPEFRKNVRFVVTHDFVRTAQESPSDETYHEFKNGETYFLIGDALGEGMWRLLSGKPDHGEQTTQQSATSPKIPEEARRVLRHELGFSFLVFRDKVQDELKLTPEQKAKLDERLREMLPDAMQFFQTIAGLKPEERATQLAAYRPKALAKLETALKEILNTGQRTRLFQLEMQREGLFGGPDLWKDLQITDQQRQQFVAASRQAQQKIAPLLQEAKATGKPDEIRPKVMQIRIDLEAKLESLLTDAQKKQWKDMLGKPMDINALFDM